MKIPVGSLELKTADHLVLAIDAAFPNSQPRIFVPAAGSDYSWPHVEQAGFAVLKAPDIPSILVETAFISNPEEEKRLNDAAYQEKMADALLAGIRLYFDRHPPAPRSRIASAASWAD